MHGEQGIYRKPVKVQRPKTSHERVVAKCIADGLIDGSHNLTVAGHQWCDSLLIDLNAQEQKRGQRFKPDIEQ